MIFGKIKEGNMADETKNKNDVENKDMEIKVIDKRFWLKDDGDIDLKDFEFDLKPKYVKQLEDRVKIVEERFKERVEEFRSETKKIHERLEREFNRRLQEEKMKVALDFIEIFDTLEKALEMVDEKTTVESLKEGMKLTLNMFYKKFKDVGIEDIGRVGEEFNPQFHEAVATEKVEDEEMDMKIVEVFKKGFKVNDRVIRPALVKVGRKS